MATLQKISKFSKFASFVNYKNNNMTTINNNNIRYRICLQKQEIQISHENCCTLDLPDGGTTDFLSSRLYSSEGKVNIINVGLKLES